MGAKVCAFVRWQHLVALVLVNLIVCDAQSASCSGTQLVSAPGRGEIVSHSGVGVTSYTNNLACTWHITAPVGSRLVAWFTYIDLEVPSDAVTFLDGTSANDIIGQISAAASASYVSPRIISVQNSMTVFFFSNSVNAGKGFRLSYDVISATNKSCGVITYSNSSMLAGVVTTSNGTQPYAANMSCLWTLPKMFGYTNQLTVANISLGDGDCLRLPTSSFLVSILNVNNTICGPITSQRTSLFIDSDESSNIVFVSNNINEAAGFIIQFQYVPVTNSSTNFTIAKSPTFNDLVSHNTVQLSPYSNNIRDYWQITAPADTKIEVWFTYLSLQYPNDAIALYNVVSGLKDLLIVNMDANASASYSESTHYTSSANVLRTAFKTDRSGIALGFIMRFTVSDAHCAGLRSFTITGPGDIVSHNAVGSTNYLSSMNCRWQITAPPGYAVVAQFTYFNLETCCDRVVLYNGTFTEPIIYSSLGAPNSSIPSLMSEKFHSTSSVMSVNFNSDENSIVGSGFRLSYSTVKLPDSTAVSDLALPLAVAIPALAVVSAIIGIIAKVCKNRRAKKESTQTIPIVVPVQQAAPLVVNNKAENENKIIINITHGPNVAQPAANLGQVPTGQPRGQDIMLQSINPPPYPGPHIVQHSIGST